MRRTITTVLLAAVCLAAAEADAQVVFKEPVAFAGTGCGAGSYSVSGEGTNTLTIMFSAYDAAVPAENAASHLERTACDFAVPVSVPVGCQISLMTADWRGGAEGDVELFREYFFAGQQGVSKTTSPSGEYTEHDGLRHKTFSVSGEDVTLRIKSAVRALTDGSYISVDSIDMKNTLILHIEQECRNSTLPAVLNLLL